MVAGTAAYMAPEQARGEPPDPRADLFALGVMMYEMLAGQHPFRGASVFETLHAILTQDPPDLLAVNEHVPPALARIVMRLLQKSPDARFQSARDLAWSLAQATDPTARPAADRTGTQQPEGTRKCRSGCCSECRWRSRPPWPSAGGSRATTRGKRLPVH